jgi:hypothetical protein
MLSNKNAALNGGDLLMGYSPNDFFYSLAADSELAGCSTINPLANSWDTSCNSVNFADNSNNCVLQQLCLNKEFGEKLNLAQNNQTGADERYLNSQSVFEYTLINIANLGIGVVVLMALIWKYRKT